MPLVTFDLSRPDFCWWALSTSWHPSAYRKEEVQPLFRSLFGDVFDFSDQEYKSKRLGWHGDSPPSEEIWKRMPDSYLWPAIAEAGLATGRRPLQMNRFDGSEARALTTGVLHAASGVPRCGLFNFRPRNSPAKKLSHRLTQISERFAALSAGDSLSAKGFKVDWAGKPTAIRPEYSVERMWKEARRPASELEALPETFDAEAIEFRKFTRFTTPLGVVDNGIIVAWSLACLLREYLDAEDGGYRLHLALESIHAVRGDAATLALAQVLFERLSCSQAGGRALGSEDVSEADARTILRDAWTRHEALRRAVGDEPENPEILGLALESVGLVPDLAAHSEVSPESKLRRRALAVLGMDEEATDSQIRERANRLSTALHPGGLGLDAAGMPREGSAVVGPLLSAEQYMDTVLAAERDRVQLAAGWLLFGVRSS